MYKESKKPCKKCGTFKRYVSNGHCVECTLSKQKLTGNPYSKKYYLTNKENILSESRKKYRTDMSRYVYAMLKRAEKRSIQKQISFNLQPSDIEIPEFCPILGTKLTIGDTSGPDDFSPSLDRIIPELGYIAGNVRVISMRANRIKTNASIADVEKVLSYMKSNHT
jgi:hypothetical protein